MWKDSQLAYLAGIIDGEGTFYIGKDNRNEKSFNSRLYVVNTDERLINWLHNNFGGLIYSRSSAKNPHWKKKFEWITHKSQILPICEAIYPYLVCKKEQADIMIKFRNTFQEKRCKNNPVPMDIHVNRLALLSDIRKLNHRDPLPL